MEMLIELLLDCILSLVVDGGVDVMSDSPNCRKWPKAVRIALVAITLLVFIAVIGLMIVIGVSLISEGKIAVGLLILAIALGFMLFLAVRFIIAYRRKR